MDIFSKSQSWGNRPRSNGLTVFLVLAAIAAIATFVVRTNSDHETRTQFEAHEFAVFRSTYESLKFQNIETRREHFRTLVDATENAKLTPAMAEHLSQFCSGIVASNEEAAEVKAEAAAALQGLNEKFAVKTGHPAGAERKPASDGP